MKLLENFPDYLLSLGLRFHGIASKKVKTSSAEIHYFEKLGKKNQPTLVILHGIGASAAHFHQTLIGLNRLGYAVLAPDLPCHGLSGDLTGEVTSDSFYQPFLDWLERVAPKNFVLIGNSLGGAMALRFAAANPTRVQKLILISPAGGFETAEDWEIFKKRLKISTSEECAQWIRDVYADPPFYVSFFSGTLLKVMSRLSIQKLIEQASFDDFFHKADIPSEFPPVLLIWGKADRVFPPEAGLEAFKKRLPVSALKVVSPNNVGHCPQLDSSTWLVNEIETFLKQ